MAMLTVVGWNHAYIPLGHFYFLSSVATVAPQNVSTICELLSRSAALVGYLLKIKLSALISREHGKTTAKALVYWYNAVYFGRHSQGVHKFTTWTTAKYNKLTEITAITVHGRKKFVFFLYRRLIWATNQWARCIARKWRKMLIWRIHLPWLSHQQNVFVVRPFWMVRSLLLLLLLLDVVFTCYITTGIQLNWA